MESCKCRLSFVIIFVHLGAFHLQKTMGDKVLGIGVEDSDNNDLLNGFTCPGEGKFAVKESGNCGKYFDCAEKDTKPSAIMECDEPHHFQFHRLNRTCVPTEYVNCRWCKKPGRHTDLTSSHHFIQCAEGTIALRYLCNHGKAYDPKERECKTDGKKFDLNHDAKLDLPEDIIQFQKHWNAAEIEQYENSKSKHHNSKRDTFGIEEDEFD